MSDALVSAPMYDDRETESAPVADRVPAQSVDPFVTTLQSRSPLVTNKHLWQWQVEALEQWYAEDCRGVIEAVTGAGKTMIGITAAFEAFKAGIRTLVIVPTAELQVQWQQRVATTIPDAIVGTLGNGRHDTLDACDVLVAIINSVAVRDELLKGHQKGMIIADECHRYAAPSFVRALSERFDYRLGLTATYARSDGGEQARLDPYFGGVVFHLWYDRALKDAVISPFKIAFVGVSLTPSERYTYDEATRRISKLGAGLKSKLNMDHASANAFFNAVHRLASHQHDSSPEFVMARKYLDAVTRRQQLLANARAKQELLGHLSDIVAGSNGTLIFSETIGTSDASADVLCAHGVATDVVSSDATAVDRRKALQGFGAGRVKALCAPRALDEGVDVPATDLAIIVSGSKQARQSIQRLGRVIRRKPDGGCGRLVLMYAKFTVEDPSVRTKHPLSTIIDWAYRHKSFDESQLHDLRRFLRRETLQASPGAASNAGHSQRSTPVLRDESIDDGRNHVGGKLPTQLGEARLTDDPVKLYLRQIGDTPLLTADEEIDLAKSIEAGLYAAYLRRTAKMATRRRGLDLEWAVQAGQNAYELFVRANLRLVVNIAKRYQHVGRQLDFLDLIQEGNAGLIHAVMKFDYRQGNRFSTYATWWIRQSITRAVGDIGRTIRFPIHLEEQLNTARRCEVRATCKDHEHSKLESLERMQPTSLDRIVDLDAERGQFSDAARLADTLLDDERYIVPDPEEVVSAELQREWLRRVFGNVLSYLPERDADVVLRRAGWYDGEKATLESLGVAYGVTRERIRQIENKAMKALRAYFIDHDTEPLKTYGRWHPKLTKKSGRK